MARKRLISRTVSVTNVEYLAVDIPNKETFTASTTISGVFKDNAALEKAVEKAINSPVVKFIAVTATTVETKLYGMTEEDFLAHATEMSKRGTLQTTDTGEEFDPVPLSDPTNEN